MTVATPTNLQPPDLATDVAVNPTLVSSEFDSDVVEKAYLTGVYDWITESFNTSDMRVPDGAWANDNDAGAVASTLPDHSVAANPLTVVGVLNKIPFDTGAP
jgi:hypothetical protein